MKKSVPHSVLAAALLAVLTACAPLNSNQQQGTAIGTGVGAGVGAILGQAIGKNTDSTLIGAGIGALVGGVAGNQLGRYMDYQEQELRNVLAASEAASIRRSQDVLTATFRGETFFHHNSATLLPGGEREVARIARVLKRYQQTRIEVGGHTDASGSERYNRQLSLQRAEAVKFALSQEGVAPQRISAVGYGESRPVSSSHAANRRVEIVIIPNQQAGNTASHYPY
ncbi:OmpA family protein [Desulfogranum mediterraneum]|uniref:OmpA family protein n=1 Tax=Desulfogranum mediterraneum TaxID=160661 RepID=UPI00042108A2|nr:OmpA family protein [Desulfogranum mediterraneum]